MSYKISYKVMDNRIEVSGVFTYNGLSIKNSIQTEGLDWIKHCLIDSNVLPCRITHVMLLHYDNVSFLGEGNTHDLKWSDIKDHIVLNSVCKICNGVNVALSENSRSIVLSPKVDAGVVVDVTYEAAAVILNGNEQFDPAVDTEYQSNDGKEKLLAYVVISPPVKKTEVEDFNMKWTIMLDFCV